MIVCVIKKNIVSQISDFQEQLPFILKILGILRRHVVSEFKESMDFMAKSTPKKLVALVLSAVMALSCLATGAVSTASAREADELDTAGIKVTAGSEEAAYGTPATNAFDDNTSTMWETNWSSGGSDTSSYDNHYIVIDLGKEYRVSGIRYTPRQDSGTNGTITKYTIYAGLTEDGMSQVASGSWEATRDVKTASFGPYRVRYIKIKCDESMHDSPTLTTSAAEIGIIGAEIGEGEDVPQPPVRETDENGNYIVTFTDENRKGDFQIKEGQGTIEYTYGEGSEGYAVFKGMNNTLAVDNMSDAIPDGFIEAELTDLDGVGRWGLIFRYTSPSQYAAICYDGKHSSKQIFGSVPNLQVQFQQRDCTWRGHECCNKGC